MAPFYSEIEKIRGRRLPEFFAAGRYDCPMKALVLALAALLTLPVAASAQAQAVETPGSHVLISTCDPHVHTAAQAHPWIDPYGIWHNNAPGFPAWDAFLGITFTNQAPTAATEIDFGLVARGSLVAVTKDVGTFSPGVEINHEFVVDREIFPLGTAIPYCAVLRVKYADGSIWTNPTPPQP